MDRFTPVPPPPRIYYHHWLAYWRLLAGLALLLLLGLASLALWPPLGAGLLAFTLTVGAALHLWRSWHTLTFLPDGRLVRRRGVGGCIHDVITLFGVITPYQMPVVGRLLDVGSVHLGIPGPDIHIRHIGNFEAFCRDLFTSEEPQDGATQQQTVQVMFFWPQDPGNGRAQAAYHPPPGIPAPPEEPPASVVVPEGASGPGARWRG